MCVASELNVRQLITMPCATARLVRLATPTLGVNLLHYHRQYITCATRHPAGHIAGVLCLHQASQFAHVYQVIKE